MSSRVCKHPYNMFHRLEGKHCYQCKCHEMMGNDFWFLPIDRCLYDDAKERDSETVSTETTK